MEEKGKVADFYDKIWADMDAIGESRPRSRHYKIMHNLRKLGLKPGAKVLEIGCGVGSLSRMVLKVLNGTGKFVGTDISPKTIELMRKLFGGRNVEFVITDMTNFTSSEIFDFIIFPDVLEHIPIEQHQNIFKTIFKLSHENTVILVNNPDPFFIEWYHANNPDKLQIIDQPLHVDHFSELAYSNGFYIESITPYSLDFEIVEYQNIILRRKKKVTSPVPMNWFKKKFNFFMLKVYWVLGL
jgi:SAM-dependent methyltransferase